MEPDPAALVRAAREDDLELLPVIQIAAGAAFREIGMAAIADSAPLSGPALAAYQQAGRAWVAVSGEDLPPGEITAGLAAALADEAAHGIDRATRVCMCRAAG